MDLINILIEEENLKSEAVIDAFKNIKRADFLPEGLKDMADLNEAIPIGYGQTISQPGVVAFMLEQLNLKPGQKVLDIGSGSGYTTALISQIVGQSNGGKVIGIDIIDELREFGEKNAEKYKFVSGGVASFVLEDGINGYLKDAPYDRILVSASGDKIFESWKKQLKIGGRIVAPVGNSVQVVIKKSESDYETQTFPGFVFVPLVSK